MRGAQKVLKIKGNRVYLEWRIAFISGLSIVVPGSGASYAKPCRIWHKKIAKQLAFFNRFLKASHPVTINSVCVTRNRDRPHWPRGGVYD